MGLRRSIGKAWGNALGGWRLQRRDSHGRFMSKGGGASRAARARSIGANLHSKGFFIAPSIGMRGGGVDAGYGKSISKHFRASISVSAKIHYNGPSISEMAKNKAADRVFGGDDKVHGTSKESANSLIKYGVARGPIEGTAVTFSDGTARLRYGAGANIAMQKNPAYRPDSKARTEAERKAKLEATEARRRAEKARGHVSASKKKRKKPTRVKAGQVTIVQPAPRKSKKSKTTRKNARSRRVATTITP